MTAPSVGSGEGREQAEVLLLGPSAVPSAATLTLLSLLRWTRRSLDEAPRAALLAGGPLARDFAEAGAAVHGTGASPLYRVEQVARRLGQPKVATVARRARLAPLYYRPPRPQVVFASTLQAAGPSLRFLGDRSRLVTHAFEPGEVLDQLVDAAMMARLAAGTTLWMAATSDVAEGLVARGVAEHRVVVVPPFLDVAEVDPEALGRARRTLAVAPGEVVVGGVGRSDWRDGPDAFIRMAAVVRRRWPDLPVRFVWVGAPVDGPTRWILDHDVDRAGISDVFTFAGEVVDAQDWIGTFDVLAQTSRVDATSPASLVAAARGIPTVAFASPDVATPTPPRDRPAPAVRDDLGAQVVPYLDVESMAHQVATLVGDPATLASVADDRRRLGRVVPGDVDPQAESLWELLETTAFGRPRPGGHAI